MVLYGFIVNIDQKPVFNDKFSIKLPILYHRKKGIARKNCICSRAPYYNRINHYKITSYNFSTESAGTPFAFIL